MKQSAKCLALLLTVLLLFSAVACNTETPNDPDTDSEETTEDETVKNTEIIATEEKQTLKLEWNQGYIGSRQHKTASFAIVEDAELYSYTDILCIKNAGTTIQFLDDDRYAGENAGIAASDILVLSTWMEKDGEWV